MNAKATNTKAMNAKSLQAFECHFGDYLRKQSHSDTDHVPSRAGQLYQSLIFNNVSGFVAQCFPVCQQVIDADTWHKLLLSFVQHGDMASPYFSEINQQFVEYLQNSDVIETLNLPPFFAELAHYEYIELYVDNLPDTPPKLFLQGDAHLALNPSVQVLNYEWQVDTISARFMPDAPQDTFIAVYRQDDFKTAFMTLNALSFILLTFIQQTDKVYEDVASLCMDVASYFNLPPQHLEGSEALFETLLKNQVFIQI